MITDKTKIAKGLVALALSQANSGVKTELLREINYTFKTYVKNQYNLAVTMLQAAPRFSEDDDSGECTAYLEFKSDDVTVVVAIEGNWSSYDGYIYSNWYFCNPKPITKIEYIRE